MHQMTFIESVRKDEPYRPQVKDLPARERPLSRLRHVGPTAVSTTELLACLLQTPDALQQAETLLARFDGLPGLVRASETEITEVNGVGPAGAARIKAALEFGRRLNLSVREDRLAVRSPSDLAATLLPEMAHLEREHFVSGHPDCTMGRLKSRFDCLEVVLRICLKLLQPSPNCLERVRTYPKSPAIIPTDIANVPS